MTPSLESPSSEKAGALSTQVGGGHYKSMKIQPVEFAHANGLGFMEGSVIKYTVRHRAKNGIEDIKKAMHFLALIAQLEYGREITIRDEESAKQPGDGRP